MSDVAVVLERLPASHGIAFGGHISAHTSTSLVVLDVPVGYLSKGKEWCVAAAAPGTQPPRCLQGHFQPLLLFFSKPFSCFLCR